MAETAQQARIREITDQGWRAVSAVSKRIERDAATMDPRDLTGLCRSLAQLVEQMVPPAQIVQGQVVITSPEPFDYSQ